MTIPAGYNLVWNDEFNGSSLDMSRWEQRVGPSSNIAVANGKLQLWANPVGQFSGSAFITVKNPTSFQYGYYECSAQISTVQGIAFAFWLLDPGSTSTEIDIVERPGNAPGYQNICVFSIMSDAGNDSGGVHQQFPDTATGFHKYALLWTETEISFYVDDVKAWNTTNSSIIASCRRPLELKLDICAAGCSFQGVVIDPPPNTPPTHVEVEYVRVYQLGGTPTKYECIDTICTPNSNCTGTCYTDPNCNGTCQGGGGGTYWLDGTTCFTPTFCVENKYIAIGAGIILLVLILR